MKVLFEFDTEDLINGGKEKKLQELKEIEKLLLGEIRKADEQLKEKKSAEHYNWLKSLPDRAF